ncbi:MAG TPA: thiol reductant ABC exporter subunit CydC, partial [Bacteroidetes bacterium]|nr:thiol reductant ABC exporter subunit CydC [Bacteroidota bacterium]
MRRCFGVVSARSHVFNLTVRENLLLARPEATEGELEQACLQAEIHDFIRSLPQGYDTPLGETGR